VTGWAGDAGDDAPPEPCEPTREPTLADALDAAVQLREQAEGVVLVRVRELRRVHADCEAPRRAFSDAWDRLIAGDEDLEVAEQRVTALRAMGEPRAPTREERDRARVVAMADQDEARGQPRG